MSNMLLYRTLVLVFPFIWWGSYYSKSKWVTEEKEIWKVKAGTRKPRDVTPNFIKEGGEVLLTLSLLPKAKSCLQVISKQLSRKSSYLDSKALRELAVIKAIQYMIWYGLL